MRAIKTICVAAFAAVLVFSASAFETGYPLNLQMHLLKDKEGVIKDLRVFISTGTNKYSLVVPNNFRQENPNPKKLRLVNADYQCYLTFQIVGSVPEDKRELDSEFSRELLLKLYPGARILSEFSASAANRKGTAFDVRLSANGASIARIAFIPSSAGILEFSLITNSDRFKEHQPYFNSLLLGFRVTNSKFDVPRAADKI
jgi:hypothetical protein